MKFTYPQKTHLNQHITRKYSILVWALALAFFVLPDTFAQKAPSKFVTGSKVPNKSNYNISGYGGTYAVGSNFNLYFGRESTTQSTGQERVVESFVVDNRSYVKGEQGASPFTKVVLKRIDNETVIGNKATAFFETGSPDPVGANVFLTPSYTNTMEELINSYVFNRGADNVFSNDGNTKNNVERIDLMFEGGITAPTEATLLNRSGILLMERGGNDPFKFAAIKSLTTGANKQVASLGELMSTGNKDYNFWGGTGTNFSSIVLQRDGGQAGNLKPSQNIGGQQVFGTFITLSDLGIKAGETIYGISLFAYDVKSMGDGSNLVMLNDGFPTNTSGTSDGGLDFMAGGGFFTANNNISGKVFHDAAPDNTKIDSNTGGQDGSLIAGLGLYVSLVNASGTQVLATVPVNANGTYSFYDVGNGSYSVVLHKNPNGSLTSELGEWFSTGEGANSTKDATANGKIELSVPTTSGESLTQSNFGINRLFSVAGTVHNDANGPLVGGVNDGPGTNAGGLHALLVNDKGIIVGSVPVNSDGTYAFPGVNAGEYTVMLSTKAGTLGTSAPASASVPEGWLFTGEDAGSGIDRIADGKVAISVKQDFKKVDFGIQRPPVAIQPQPEIIPSQPTVGTVYTIKQPLSGNDAEDSPVTPYDKPTVKIIGGSFTTVPDGNVPDAAPVWFYDLNGDGIPDNNEIINPSNGVVIENFDYTKLKVQLNGKGYSGTGFEFQIVDNAGAESQSVKYALTWANPLPVSLITFSATIEEQVIQLSWTTAAETKSDLFEIQRSRDAKTWQPIGERTAAGESTTFKKYSFADAEPLTGTNYYRLKMIDKDGTYAYSRIINQQTEIQKPVLFPNPVVSVLNLKAISVEDIKSITLIDTKGRTVYHTQAISSEGINVSGFADGIYQVRILKKDGSLSVNKVVISK